MAKNGFSSSYICKKHGVTEFYTVTRKSGLSAGKTYRQCLVCRAEIYSRWRSKRKALCHPDRAYRNKGKCNSCYRQELIDSLGYKAVIATERSSTLRRRFGLTQEAYLAMLTAQNGVCKICKEPEPEGKHLAVDHSHTTGVIRGLLCAKCNLTCGQIEKNPDRFLKAFAYLNGA